nr:hypothetical protein [Effusibacillus pohliae]
MKLLRQRLPNLAMIRPKVPPIGEAVAPGKVYKNLMVNLQTANRKLHDRIVRIIQEAVKRRLEKAGGRIREAVSYENPDRKRL